MEAGMSRASPRQCFVSRLPRVATFVYPSVSAYQGTTLVGPLRANKDLGFSPWVFRYAR